MTRQRLTKLLILVGAVAVAGVCLFAGLSKYENGKKRSLGVQSVEILPAEIETVTLDEMPVETPAPEAPDVPYGAVDIAVDGVRALCVSNENTAEAVLTKYLSAMATADEGETFLSAAYECDIRFLPADGSVPYYDFDTAFELLYSEPTLVPVTVKTLKRSFSTGQVTATVDQNENLYEGVRRIAQLGSGAVTATDTELTYVGDTLTNTASPVTNVVSEARNTMIEQGTFNTSNKDDDAGRAWKELPEKLRYPMRGSVKRYFGVENGNMHAGVDIENKEGTPVVAPGEGVVAFAGVRGDYGFTVDIDHGSGFTSRLTHLSDVSVELNQRVFSGDAIGKLQKDGVESEKPVLHYELIVDGIPVNPLFYIK